MRRFIHERRLTVKTNKEQISELTNLTVSMLLSFAYLLVVCWALPLVPMMITWMLGWPFTTFLYLWLGGLPFIVSVVYYLFKIRPK
jgi:hypothetical protein